MRKPDPEIIVATEDAEAFQLDALARLPLVTEIAMGALKSLMLINGGAVVALLTFLGNAPAGRYDMDALKAGLAFFIGGLVLTTFAHVCGYFAQGKYYHASNYQAWNAQAKKLGREEKWKSDVGRQHRLGAVAEAIAIASVIGSIGCFGWGAWNALDGILPAPLAVNRAPAPEPTPAIQTNPARAASALQVSTQASVQPDPASGAVGAGIVTGKAATEAGTRSPVR